MPFNLDKPDEYQQGVGLPTGRTLNKLRTPLMRQIRGSGGVDVVAMGDRLLIRGPNGQLHTPSVENYVAKFAVVEEFDDYLKCAVARIPVDGDGEFAAGVYDPALGADAVQFVYVAKPYLLQNAPWDGETVDGLTYANDGVGQRTATNGDGDVTQSIEAPYMTGEVIFAVNGLTGLKDPANNQIVWTDINAAGRIWSATDLAGPIPGEPLYPPGTTVNFISNTINSVTSVWNFLSSSVVNIASAFTLNVLAAVFNFTATTFNFLLAVILNFGALAVLNFAAGATLNFLAAVINLSGTTVNFLLDATWNIASGKYWTISGPGTLVIDTTFKAKKDVFLGYADVTLGAVEVGLTLPNAGVVRFTPHAGGSDLHSAVPHSNTGSGHLQEWVNVSTTDPIYVLHNSPSEANTAQRIFNPKLRDVTIPPCGSAWAWYDPASGKFRLEGHPLYVEVGDTEVLSGTDKRILYDDNGQLGEYTPVQAGDYVHSSSSDIASAATTDLSTATGDYVHVTGTTTITSFGTCTAGTERDLVFDGALTLTHNATSLILPTGANITTAAGDAAHMRSEGGSNWRCICYQRKDGTALSGGSSSAVDTGTVAMFGNAVPAGWLECDGSTFSNATYPALATYLGDTWGAHSGANYYLPDLRSRVPIAVGTGAGLSARTVAGTGGTETVTIGGANLPAHTHTVASNAAPGAGVLLAGGAIAGAGTSITSSTGSGTGMGIMNPYVGLRFGIKT